MKKDSYMEECLKVIEDSKVLPTNKLYEKYYNKMVDEIDPQIADIDKKQKKAADKYNKFKDFLLPTNIALSFSIFSLCALMCALAFTKQLPRDGFGYKICWGFILTYDIVYIILNVIQIVLRHKMLKLASKKLNLQNKKNALHDSLETIYKAAVESKKGE